MSHFLLASRPVAGFAERDPRYGREALSLMIDGLRNSGVSVAQCEAKIFGGGNMFPHRISGNSLAIGKQNGKAATALVQELGIPVVSKCLYGTAHRQIVFRIATGDVWVRRPSPVNLQEAEAIK